MIDRPDLKKGFWLGLGLVGAFIVWGLASLVLAKLRSRANG
jgi:hypothetical protein